MNGKGSKRRPLSPFCTQDQFNENWDNIFKQKNSNESIYEQTTTQEDGTNGEENNPNQ